jgi:membrane-associated phospholipid phosphatase
MFTGPRAWQNPLPLMLGVNLAVVIGVFLHKILLPPYVPYIHLLVDYHFGFTKRALIGALVGLFTAKVPVWLVFALAIVAWRVPGWRTRIIFSLIVLVLCWRGADLLQHVFARPRRLDWIVKHETAFSYPSSHATIAVGFYALWGVMFYLSELRANARKVVGTVLILLAIAICWARLALGAHYITDVVGGALLAVAIVAAGVAISPRPVLRPEAAGRVARAAE